MDSNDAQKKKMNSSITDFSQNDLEGGQEGRQSGGDKQRKIGFDVRPAGLQVVLRSWEI